VFFVVVVYFVIDSVRNLLVKPWYICNQNDKIEFYRNKWFAHVEHGGKVDCQVRVEAVVIQERPSEDQITDYQNKFWDG
jgi:hypothetical protein